MIVNNVGNCMYSSRDVACGFCECEREQDENGRGGASKVIDKIHNDWSLPFP